MFTHPFSSYVGADIRDDRYSVAYNPIILLCISFMFIEIKCIHYHFCAMFTMKPMSTCNY